MILLADTKYLTIIDVGRVIHTYCSELCRAPKFRFSEPEVWCFGTEPSHLTFARRSSRQPLFRVHQQTGVSFL
jgi:hypothetical protein